MAKKKNTLKPVGTYAQGMQNNLTKKQNTVGAYSDRLNMLRNSIDKIKAQQEQKRAEEERQRQIRQQATDETRKMQTLSRDLRYGYGQKYDPALAYQATQMGVKADRLRGMVEEDEKTYNALNRLAKEAEALKDTGYAGIQKDRKNYNTGSNLTMDQFFRVQGKQRDNQAEGLYDNGDNPMLMSPEGLAAYRTQAENWVKHYKDQAKRYTNYNEDDALAGLFDRMYERDIANEQAIINNPAYKGTAYETTAQGRLATLESERNEARRQAVENARRMMDSGLDLKGATPEEQEKIRREVYDWILPDGYDQRTAQNKAEIDAAIDEYINGVRSPWGDSRTQADAINAANRQAAAWESRLKTAEDEESYRGRMGAFDKQFEQMRGMGISQTYDPTIAPQVQTIISGDDMVYQPQGSEADKAYWWANNYGELDQYGGVNLKTANKYMFLAADPEILDRYNTFYQFDKQNGTNSAQAFLDGIDPYLSTMLTNYQDYYARSIAEKPVEGLIARGATYGAAPVMGLIGTAGAITALFGNESAKDNTSNWYAGTRFIQDVRSQQNEDVGKWADRVIGDGSGDVAKFMLGVIDSIGDNVTAMGGATMAAGEGTKTAMRLVQMIMSGEATSTKMVQNLEDGMDPTEAALSAVGDGVIEWLTERYSLEQIMGPDVRQLYGNKRAMASFLARSAGAEGSEEIASGILETGLDSILSMVYGHEDEITKRYNELVTSNPTMSHEEASRIAMEEKLQEIGLEGLAGSLSGLAMSGSRAISTALETRAEGRTVKSNDGGIDTMLSLAQKMKEGTESRTLADKLSAEIEKGSKVSNYDLGRLANLTALDVGETRSQVIRDTVGRNVEKQLTDAGIGEQEAKKYGEIITRSIFEGKRLSKSDIQTLGQDERAIKLWGDFNTMSQASLNLSKEVKAETKELDSIAQQVGELTTEPTAEESAAAAEVQKSIQEAGSMEEAIDNLQARRSGLISEGYANLAKQVLKDNPLAKKSKTYLDDIMKIRLAAMTMDSLPKTALDKDVAQKFYDAAKAEFDEVDADRVVPQAPAQEGRGSATFEGAEYGTQAWKDATQGLSKMTRNVMGAVGEIAARFGNRVNLVNDPENPDIYGFEDANTGAITINVANGFKHHMLVTLAHEMTHWLEQNSRGGYNDLRSFVLDSLRKEGVNVQDRIVKIMDNYNMVMGDKAGSGLTINQAMAELVAQSSEGLLSSRNTMQELRDINPGLFNKVREYVKDVVARINAAIRGMEYESSLSQEAKALKNYRDQLANIWLEGRKDAQGQQEPIAEQTEVRNEPEEGQKEQAQPQKSFSLANAVEERADGLVAVHNLGEEELMSTLAEGGITAPSIAVVKESMGHSKYGSVSVVLYPDAINPRKSSKNRVYGADAYTPERYHARVEQEIVSKEVVKASRDIQELLKNENSELKNEASNWFNSYLYDDETEKTLKDIVEYAYNNVGMLAAYQKSKGNDIEVKMRERFTSNASAENIDAYNDLINGMSPEMLSSFIDDYKSAYIEDMVEKYAPTFKEILAKRMDRFNRLKLDGSDFEKRIFTNWFRQLYDYLYKGITKESVFDKYGTKDLLEEKTDKNEFISWLTDKLQNVLGKKGIRNNQDRFTNMGKRKTFNQLHKEYTAENVVKAMYENAQRKGVGADYFQGLMATTSKEYRSLSEVKNDADRLRMIPEEEYEAYIKEKSAEMDAISREIIGEGGGYTDDARRAFVEAGKRFAVSPTINTIKSAFKAEGYTLTDETAQKVYNLMKEAQEAATGYFEAKPERVIGFDEIARVIVPEGTDKALIDALDNAGIEYDTYDGTDEDRLAKLNAVPNVQFSIRQSPDMEVNNFMLGLNEFNLSTYQEKTMLRQYKDSRTRADLLRYGIREREIERRKLLAKEKRSIKDNKRLGEINRFLDRDRAKLDSLEKELVRVTGDKGYARLMMNQENVMKNLTTGQSAAELEETVNNIQQNLDNVTKEMAERAEELKKLASAEAVVKIRQQFNARGLKEIAAKLKSQLNSELDNKEIENRLALIALKMKAGQYDAENAEELADLLAGRMKAEYDGYVISELRGSTITLGPVQLKELKGSGRSLSDIKAQLAGTGIRIGTTGSATLDSKWDDLCKVIPSLDPETQAGNQLDELLKKINDEKAMRKTVYTDENMMNINRMVLEAAQQLIPEIITDEKSLKLIRESMALVARISGAAKSGAEAMDEINSLIEKLQKRGQRAIVQAKKLTGDIESTIEYFDQLSLQSEAAMWKSERIRLIEQMKSDNTRALMEEADRWRERIEKDKAFREAVGENQLIRRKITTNTSRIRKLLINETDLKNIPEHMKGLARELLGKIVNNDLAGRKITNIEKQDLIETARVLAAMKELDGEYSPDDLRLIADEEAQSVIADALADLEEGLEEYNGRRKGTKDVNVKTVHDQLQKVLDAVTTITGIINAERSVSFLDRQVTVGEAADDVRRDFENTRFRGELKGPGSKAITMAKRTVVYGNMTPEYYIENLRNRGMTELWQDMKRGENRNGLEVRKAQEHMARLAEETGYKAWANEKHDVTLGGMKRTLTIGNMMELYAIWQREHTSNPEMSQHLNKGGVYFQEEEKQTGKLRHEQTQQRAIRVTDEEIQAMYDSMTPQQKQLIDGVVKYLSNDMSDLGNEASMRMYGIKKYKETYYFPMKVWDGVKSARSDKGITGTDENRAAHKSWSKRRQHMAQNALVIGDFMTDAINHIVEMINYNTMAPSIENINKVLNYKFTEEAGTDNETQRNLRVMFQENYGTESLKYLEDLLKDLNGGPAQDQRKTLRDRLLSVFKKNAVAGSMSVALQQPLSYIRAAMMISPKYLAEGLGKFWKGSYEEMITHSGVAVIKDMGRFDMNFGQSAKDYITPETGRNLYGKASDMLTKAPELMDRMTWTRMWSAVKAEQAAKNPGMDIKSEAFMNKVTERFNELMRKTQVYDSILVKSSNMRSTNLGMKVITSFMAEPTLSLNVLADAISNAGAEGGKTKLAKAGATFLLSAVMQAVVKGLMGSGRTPDKKKTWAENFMNKLQQNLINEANPVSLIPGYSDIIEVLKTGELKDDAMGAIGKLFSIGDTLRKAAAGNGKGGWRDVEDTFGQFVQLFTNIPLKNLMRDGRAMYNWASGSEYAQRPTSSAVLSYQFEANNFTADNIIGTLNAWLGEAGFKTTNTSYYSRIYQAQKNGNAGEAAGLKEYMSLGKGASDDAIKAGIKAAAKKDTSLTEAERDAWMIDNDLMGENNVSTITTQYKEGKITRAEAEKLYRKLDNNLTDNDLWWKLDRLDYQKETGADSVSGYSYRLKDAIQSNKAEEIRKVIKDMLDHGRTQKQIKDALSDWKSEYLAADAKTKTTIRDALQKAYKAMGLTAADADKVINGWTKQKTKKTK